MIDMTEYSSKFGEEVFITDDDLVELKLTQKPWVITSVPLDLNILGLNITAVITEIYDTTNLFSVVDKKSHRPIEITPKVEIVLKQDGETVVTRALFVGNNYFANS